MTTSIEIGGPNWQDANRDRYLRTNGAEGQFVDFSRAGGSSETPCLLLKTTGRHSGEARVLPLIYGEDGGRYVIVASKGGAPEHPGWYRNIEQDPNVELQVLGDVFPATARTAEGEERDRLWAKANEVWPHYAEYQEKTEREIPVVVLERAA